MRKDLTMNQVYCSIFTYIAFGFIPLLRYKYCWIQGMYVLNVPESTVHITSTNINSVGYIGYLLHVIHVIVICDRVFHSGNVSNTD